MGCGGLALIWGTVAFAVIGGVWWLATGHPPKELVWWYLWFLAFVLVNMADSYITSWRNETKEAAARIETIEEELKRVTERLDDLERQSRDKS